MYVFDCFCLFNDLPRRAQLLGVPDTNQQSACGGESGGNCALYVAARHLLAQFAERVVSFVSIVSFLHLRA